MMGLKEVSQRTLAMLTASDEVLALTGYRNPRIYPVAAPRGTEGYTGTWVAYRHAGTTDDGSKDGTALLRQRVELTVASATMNGALDAADACRRALERGDDRVTYALAGYEEDYDEAMELYVVTLMMEGLAC